VTAPGPWAPREGGGEGTGPGLPAEVVTVGETMGCFLLRGRSESCGLTFIGAESNVAIGLASLGHRVRWASRLGEDRIGDLIARSLLDRSVDVHAPRDDRRPTGVAIKELGPGRTTVRYYRGGSAASAMTAVDAPALAGVRWLHLTGITPALSASCADMTSALAEAAARAGVRISFDVNLRPVLWDGLEQAREAIVPLCRHADLVFIGDDEAGALELGDSAARFARAVGVREDAIIVFKRGAQGADALAHDVAHSSAAIPGDVVDVTGAGDAFAAGFLGGMLRELPVAACLRLGHVMASRVIGTDRDFVGPLSSRNLADLLRSVESAEDHSRELR
jgi:2-dehydro-3-deoxygluconokinase